jgi:long-subunit fatty acid transport protein
MKRSRRFLTLLAAFAIASVPSIARAQCDGASRLGELYGGTIDYPPELRVEVRPDLSNPGARALAIGGAFVSTADDGTSVVANPAGLGSIVRPTVQLEARPNPVLQYDRFNTGLLSTTNQGVDAYTSEKKYSFPPPVFASAVFPVGDTFVMAAFGQLLLETSDREVNRIGSAATAGAGPCFSTRTPSGLTRNVLVPLYRLDDRSSTIWRAGLSFAYRATARLSLGGTVYYASESRDQTIFPGDALGPQAGNDYTLDASSGAPGFIVGLQFTANEKLRFGAQYSHEVKFGDENAARTSALVKRTVMPARAGVGLTFAPTSRLSFAADGVWVRTSALKNAVDFERGFEEAGFLKSTFGAVQDDGNWEQKDAIEVRLGAEITVVQTRTKTFVLRAGYWMESPSNLKFTAGSSVDTVQAQAAYDAVRVLAPNVNDPWWKHVTGGFGFAANKRLQIDMGVDYEFELEKWVASALLGYTF